MRVKISLSSEQEQYEVTVKCKGKEDTDVFDAVSRKQARTKARFSFARKVLGVEPEESEEEDNKVKILSYIKNHNNDFKYTIKKLDKE